MTVRTSSDHEVLRQAIRLDASLEVRKMVEADPHLLNAHCSNGWTPLIVCAWERER